jgi:hypothetical protein
MLSVSAPKQALSRYLADYSRHRNMFLQMDGFQRSLPAQKTTETVLDTTLKKITREHSHMQPRLLLTYRKWSVRRIFPGPRRGEGDSLGSCVLPPHSDTFLLMAREQR